MIIQLYEQTEEIRPKSRIIEVNIDENLSIGALINEIHEITQIPKKTKLEWDDRVEFFPYRYFYGEGDEYGGFSFIHNLDEKISEIPKQGKNGELILYFDGSVGLVN